ncbi:MAG: head-tail connector protein [Hyphomicrobiales bacterium]|nr:head-tail connector protein [Hyphomicrobiales bacterium]
MTVLLITPPAVEPVSLDEAKAHLRLTGSDDDDYLSALIVAARLQVETAIRRVLIDQTWRIYRDDWPADGLVDLPLAPIRSVAEITVYDADGAPKILSSAAWQLDAASSPARLKLLGAGPSPGRPLNGVEIDVVAGYGPSGVSVPQPLRLAIMMLVARWFENREGAAYGVVPSSVADAFEALIAPFRVLRLT